MRYSATAAQGAPGTKTIAGTLPGYKELSVGQMLAEIISIVGRLLTLTLVINALLSWAPIDPMHPIRRTLNDICEPMVRPFRAIMPQTGMMDFSPLVAMIAIQIITVVLASVVRQIVP